MLLVYLVCWSVLLVLASASLGGVMSLAEYLFALRHFSFAFVTEIYAGIQLAALGLTAVYVIGRAIASRRRRRARTSA